MPTVRFRFAEQSPWARALPRALREPPRAMVTCDDIGIDVRFGPFRMRTPWTNIVGVQASGPLRWYRAIGPRLSLADRGATFGTATDGGVCIRFQRPVAALFGPLRIHPGLTVTVADPAALIRTVQERAELATD